MSTQEELRARHEELRSKFDAFYETVKNLPHFESAGIGFVRPGDLSAENMGFVVHLNKDVNVDAVLAGVERPTSFQDEPVVIRNAPETIPEDSGTRPIQGGIQTSVDKSAYGTLGGVAKRNSTGKAVLVSNHHVFYGHGKGDGDTVYQPSPSCCNSYAVGKNVLGIDGTVDAAIAEASVAVTNTIKDIGTIVGIATATCGAIIEKTGAKTGHTKGVITNVQLAPPTSSAITVIGAAGYSSFTEGGDSGSFYVNADKRVVGLHNSGNVIGGIKHSYGADINNVVAQMGITIPNPDVTAGVNMALILSDHTPDMDIEKYEKEANKSVNGRAGLQLIKQYADEVQNLVHHDRAVTVVWLDNKGPQFGEAWQDAESDPTKKLPKTVDGVTLESLINNMADILVKKGSPGLAEAIHTYKPAVLAALPKLDSVQDLTDFINGGHIHCFAVMFFWSLLWDSGTEFYLPAVAKNGLVDPNLGIDIKPFSTIKIGDIPEITMFDEPVLGYMKLAMTGTQVSGLDTVSGGQMSCTDNEDGTTTMTFGLKFGRLVFSGNYAVTAGGGIGGCAIAGAAAVLGGGGLADDMIVFGAPDQAGVDQALWYREPLGRSANGRALIGNYYANQDAIVDLQQDDGGDNPYMQSLAASNVRSTTKNVTTATTYYQKQQQGLLTAEDGPPPTIGSDDQYNSGQLPYAYLIAMARKKVREGKDPDGRFAKLADDATGFIHSISWYRSTYPGEQPIGGDDGVMNRIANADPDAIKAYILAQPPYPVRDPDTDEIVEHLSPKAIDMRRAFDAYHRNVAHPEAELEGSSVHGTFADEGLDISIQITMTLSGNMKADPQADVSRIQASIGDIHITLSSSGGWWPGLFDKVSNWIANNKFFLDLLRTQVQNALQSESVKASFGNLLEGAMKKLG